MSLSVNKFVVNILSKKYNVRFNLNSIEYFLLYRKTKKYFQIRKNIFLSNVRIGNIIFLEILCFESFGLRKYFFLGLCIGLMKKKMRSCIILRNLVGGILIEQKLLIFNNLIVFLRISKRRVIELGFKKSKLFFLLNLPFFFRLNKSALLETFYYSNKKKQRKRKRLVKNIYI